MKNFGKTSATSMGTSISIKLSLIIGKIMYIAGLCSYVMGALLFSGLFMEDFNPTDISTFIIGALLFIAIGFALCRTAKKNKINAENVRLYIPIIVNGNARRLDSIAETTGRPFEVVREDIQKIIQKGYLKNAYIDESTREVVLKIPEVEATSKKLNTKIIVCPCCGANNTVVGNIGECEYCGSSLK